MFDRKLLTKLSRCAWKAFNLYLTQAVPYDDPKPGATIAVQSFGDFQNFKLGKVDSTISFLRKSNTFISVSSIKNPASGIQKKFHLKYSPGNTDNPTVGFQLSSTRLDHCNNSWLSE